MSAVTKLKPEKTPEAAEVAPAGLALLRQPFPAHLVSKLPKETKKQIEERRAGNNVIRNCPECGGYHHKNAVHLDYVGHAALTDRLLDTDPHWTWEPVSFGQDGLPAFDRNGGLWIKLTVLDVTRLGYGAADGKSGGDAVKEIIGDALRNAAMRFGAALDLWHKGDLHPEEDAPTPTASSTGDGGMPDAEWTKLVQLIEATKSDTGAMCKHYGVENLRQLNQDQFGNAVTALNTKLSKMVREETNAAARKVEQPKGEFADLDADSIPY